MTNVLVVIDSGFRYAPPEPGGWEDFTFVRLVEVFEDAGFNVTKAHRGGTDPAADLTTFRFDGAGVTLSNYDVIWLMGIGAGATSLSEDELLAVQDYMDSGGGMFATGDHESLGAELCGYIPRVRLMRAWYTSGALGDSPVSGVANFPTNFDQVGVARADTTQRNPNGTYPDADTVWFENQSDSVPQPLSPTTAPAHPILRDGSRELVVYADHMHEGQTLGPADLAGIYNYSTSLPLTPGSANTLVDFAEVNGHRELPLVIATGESTDYSINFANTGSSISGEQSDKTINTLCVYDGFVAGVGRVVTSSTWHHYIDINLDGSSSLNATGLTNAGADAEKGEGFFGTNTAASNATWNDIKQVFVNIVHWLERPRPSLELILERSTISQDEATADSDIENAILVSVNGLRPGQFPGGPITSLGTPAQLANWAPPVTFPANSGLTAVPTRVDSDDPALSDRIQRFTFTYRIDIDVDDAFDFGAETATRTVSTSLAPIGGSAQSDSAIMTLVKSANPFMLDLANGNTTNWLSSDVRVFPVVTGRTMNGRTLPLNASRAQALTFLRQIVGDMTVAQFESLALSQSGSALSPLPTTTVSNRRVYNFAIARVRLNGSVAEAENVRMFFRIFAAQTTASLTYSGGTTGGYQQTPGATPISLPSPNGSGSEWMSLPMFSAERELPPADQEDPDNVADIGPAGGSEISEFFGALIDSNLDGAYLPETPNSGDAAQSVRELLVGEHQCLVAQIEYDGTPIPNGARPSTSDKLSQRNIAFNEVANPGRADSRVALHTFEIERTRGAISETQLPDELILTWPTGAPKRTHVEIYISTWDAQEVVDLANAFYPRHEITVVDENTIAVPAGGTRYVPVPSSQIRQVGVVSAHLPIGIKRGQRYDLSVRQITNRSRDGKIPRTETKRISEDEAWSLLREPNRLALAAATDVEVDIEVDIAAEVERELPKGAFDLGDGLTLVTDLRLLDEFGEGAILVQKPDPKKLAAAVKRAGRWRELVGAFQLGIPVSTKGEMLNYQLRLLSLMFWRLETLPAGSRWLPPLKRYVEMSVDKVRALGGRPELVPATPDGIFDLEEAGGKPGGNDDGGGKPDDGPGAGDNGDGNGADDGGPGGGPGDGPAGDNGDDTPAELEPVEDWLGEPGPKTSHLWSGKVSGLLYDHFGDFEGFTLESYRGRHVRFFARESDIERLAKEAWQQRYVVSVVSASSTDRTVIRLLIRGYA